MIFFVLRGSMIFFCPKRLRDFFLNQEVACSFGPERLHFFLVPIVCVIFLSQEVGFFLFVERLVDFFCPERCFFLSQEVG